MSLFQFFMAMEKYSIDILSLALLVTIITSFLKRFLFKNAKSKKLLTFVPFILGIIAYASYVFIINKNFQEAISVNVLNYGFKTGGVATIYYVFYEQFIRQKKSLIGAVLLNPTETAISGILENIVQKEFIETMSKSVYSILSNNSYDVNLLLKTVCDLFQGKVKNGVSDLQILATSRLILKTYTILKT